MANGDDHICSVTSELLQTSFKDTNLSPKRHIGRPQIALQELKGYIKKCDIFSSYMCEAYIGILSFLGMSPPPVSDSLKVIHAIISFKPYFLASSCQKQRLDLLSLG